jgi:multidrug efflux pump
VSIDIANDNSVFIDRSIKSVYTTIIEAVVLVALVILVFLRTFGPRSFRCSPSRSLIGTFALMALAGFTINTLTLLALVLAIGLVVDDAIVMLENIYRHIEEGMDPLPGGAQGFARGRFRDRGHDHDAGGGVCAAGLCAGPHRAPVHRVRAGAGRVRWWCRALVALTLSPMLCSLLLRHNPKPNWFFDRWHGAGAHGMTAATKPPLC